MSVIGTIAPIALRQAQRAYLNAGPANVMAGGGAAVTSAAGIADRVGGAGGPDFAGMVGQAASAALQTLRHSEKVTALGVAGRADVQDVVQAASDAEMTVKSTVAILGKVQAAYNDIMRMSV